VSRENLMTVRQVAQRLQVDEQIVLDWLGRGELRGIRQGTRALDWRVSEGALRRFLDSRRSETEGK
jgi:excisionase family DNA binding protein